MSQHDYQLLSQTRSQSCCEEPEPPPPTSPTPPYSKITHSVYHFIITGAKMVKVSNKINKKLAQRWVIQANERMNMDSIQVESVCVDGKHSTERKITVNSALTKLETRECGLIPSELIFCDWVHWIRFMYNTT